MTDLEELRQRCEEIQTDFFASRALIIASNRGPVTFETDEEGSLDYQRGSGGLVTALTGLVQQVDATWIACARTEADATWHEGRVSLSGGDSQIRVRFLSPEPEAYKGYYSVIANPLLWFLQHSMWDVSRAPVIDADTWDAWKNGYIAVNRLFADTIVEQTRSIDGPTVVMLQDYHLYRTPRLIWEQMRPAERPTLLHFIHIPWPGPEYWRILPRDMREPILDGLLAADILGFQTREDGLDFLRTCESHLENAYAKYGKKMRVWYRNHATYVRDFPISIDVQALKELAKSKEVAKWRQEIEGLVGDKQFILRIDRIEPSKNIIRGFQAYEEMLELYPEHRGNVKFLALLVQSRLGVDEYQDYLAELNAAAGRVNAMYGDSEWEPVRVLLGDNYPRAVAALQMYDVLLVNAIADGMNLVAKEGSVVNRRDGVLVLSERTGAREQLEAGAIVIPPCDVYATAEALHEGLTKSKKARSENARLLRKLVEQEDINTWFCSQLDAIKKLKV